MSGTVGAPVENTTFKKKNIVIYVNGIFKRICETEIQMDNCHKLKRPIMKCLDLTGRLLKIQNSKKNFVSSAGVPTAPDIPYWFFQSVTIVHLDFCVTDSPKNIFYFTYTTARILFEFCILSRHPDSFRHSLLAFSICDNCSFGFLFHRFI